MLAFAAEGTIKRVLGIAATGNFAHINFPSGTFARI
jgi:hypothetical protein